jgi:aminoglycoside phosphotransferase (APT) family kinase protein
MFYVMSMVEGRIIWNGRVPGVSREERRAIYESQIDTLAALHSADYKAIGLEDFGRPATTSSARSTAGPSSTSPARP